MEEQLKPVAEIVVAVHFHLIKQNNCCSKLLNTLIIFLFSIRLSSLICPASELENEILRKIILLHSKT
jgi:hypothetical protein